MISCSKTVSGFSPAVFAVALALCMLTATACLSGHAEGTTRTLTGHGGEVLAVAFAPDGRLLASGSSDQTIRLWDPVTGEERKLLRGHTGAVRSLAFAAHNSQLLTSGSADSTVRIWDVAQGREIKTLSGRFGAMRGVALAPDGQSLASVGDDGSLRLWDWKAGKEIKATKSRLGILMRSFSPPMGQPWPRVEANRWHTYGTWLPWADAVSIRAMPGQCRRSPLRLMARWWRAGQQMGGAIMGCGHRP